MKKFITQISFIFLIQFCIGQEAVNEFSGRIEYKIEINALRQDKLDSFIASIGNKEVITYSRGKFRFDNYLDDVRIMTRIVTLDSMYLYKFTECPDKITAYNTEYNNNRKAEESSTAVQILGYRCKKLIYSSESVIESFYYSVDLKILDSNLPHHIPSFISLTDTKSIPLRFEIEFKGVSTIIKTAVNIIEQKLSDSVFTFTSNNIVYNPPSQYTDNSYKLSGDEFMKCGNYSDAIKMYSKALVFNKYDYDALYNRALSYFNLNLNIRACEDLSILKKQNDKEASILYKKNCNCNSLKSHYQREIVNSISDANYEAAIKYFDLVIQCNNNDTNAIYNRAISKYNNNEKMDAFEDILLAIEYGDTKAKEFLDNKYDRRELSNAYYKLGNDYFEKKQYEDAIVCFNIVLSKYPDSKAALRNRGKTYMKLKDSDKACSDLSKAADLEDEEAIKLMKNKCK